MHCWCVVASFLSRSANWNWNIWNKIRKKHRLRINLFHIFVLYHISNSVLHLINSHIILIQNFWINKLKTKKLIFSYIQIIFVKKFGKIIYILKKVWICSLFLNGKMKRVAWDGGECEFFWGYQRERESKGMRKKIEFL